MREEFAAHEGPVGERKGMPSTRFRSCGRRSSRSTAEIQQAEQQLRPEQGGGAASTASCPSCKRSWQAEEDTEQSKEDRACSATSVTEEEIARIVARWTGIPVAKLMEGEREKLLHLDEDPAQAGHRPGRGGAEGHARPSSAPGPASRIPTGPLAPSCSWAPPAWARPSWPRLWPRACLTMRTTWCVSI